VSVRPLSTGTIATVQVHEGDSVVAGDPLLSLDSTDSEVELAQIESEILQNSEAVALFEREIRILEHVELSAPEPPMPILKSDYGRGFARLLLSERRSLVAQMAELTEERKRLKSLAAVKNNQIALYGEILPLKRERYNQAEQLMDQGLPTLSRSQWSDLHQSLVEMEHAELQQHLELQENTAQDAVIVAKTTTLLAEQRRHIRERLVDHLQRLQQAENSHRSMIKHREDNILRAPVSGIIHQFIARSPGTVVQAGEELLIVVPSKVDLEILALAQNQDVGWLYPGQPVSIKIVSFPFTTHGMLSGEVVRIGADAIEDKTSGALVFPVTVRLSQTQSHPRLMEQLAPGMACVAEMKLEERRLLEVWLSPLRRHLTEAFREQ
jgi:hemolysin D